MRDFEKRQAEFDRSFNLTQKFIKFWFCFVFILVISGFILSAVIGYNTYETIKRDGLKGVVQDIWEGEKKDVHDF
jgi:hypothetical protein